MLAEELGAEFLFSRSRFHPGREQTTCIRIGYRNTPRHAREASAGSAPPVVDMSSCLDLQFAAAVEDLEGRAEGAARFDRNHCLFLGAPCIRIRPASRPYRWRVLSASPEQRAYGSRRPARCGWRPRVPVWKASDGKKKPSRLPLRVFVAAPFSVGRLAVFPLTIQPGSIPIGSRLGGSMRRGGMPIPRSRD